MLPPARAHRGGTLGLDSAERVPSPASPPYASQAPVLFHLPPSVSPTSKHYQIEAHEAAVLAESAAYLAAQLRMLDPAFVECVTIDALFRDGVRARARKGGLRGTRAEVQLECFAIICFERKKRSSLEYSSKDELR